MPNAVVGQAVAVGGLGQVLAGIGDYFIGNVSRAKIDSTKALVLDMMDL